MGWFLLLRRTAWHCSPILDFIWEFWAGFTPASIFILLYYRPRFMIYFIMSNYLSQALIPRQVHTTLVVRGTRHMRRRRFRGGRRVRDMRSSSTRNTNTNSSNNNNKTFSITPSTVVRRGLGPRVVLGVSMGEEKREEEGETMWMWMWMPMQMAM